MKKLLILAIIILTLVAPVSAAPIEFSIEALPYVTNYTIDMSMPISDLPITLAFNYSQWLSGVTNHSFEGNDSTYVLVVDINIPEGVPDDIYLRSVYYQTENGIKLGDLAFKFDLSTNTSPATDLVIGTVINRGGQIVIDYTSVATNLTETKYIEKTVVDLNEVAQIMSELSDESLWANINILNNENSVLRREKRDADALRSLVYSGCEDQKVADKNCKELLKMCTQALKNPISIAPQECTRFQAGQIACLTEQNDMRECEAKMEQLYENSELKNLGAWKGYKYIFWLAITGVIVYLEELRFGWLKTVLKYLFGGT